MRRKWTAFLMVCIMAVYMLAPTASAETYNVSGVTVTLPEGDVLLSHEEENIVFENNMSGMTMVTVVALESLGVDEELIDMFSEDMLLKLVGGALASDSVLPEGEVTEIAGRSCYLSNTEDHGFQSVTALVLEGTHLVFIQRYFYKDVDADEATAALEDLMGCISQSEAGVEESVSSDVQQMDAGGYSLNDGTMVLHISEDDYNIFTANNAEDSPSLSRTGYTKTQMDLYVDAANLELFILPYEAKDTKFSIHVKSEESMYTDQNALMIDDSEWELICLGLMAGFGQSKYETVVKDDARYCVIDYQVASSNSRRYTTIHNGYMIYIWASRDNAELTQEDIALLEDVVNAIEYR